MRRGHRRMHARIWIILAVLLPVGVALAIIMAGSPPADPGVDALLAAGAED